MTLSMRVGFVDVHSKKNWKDLHKFVNNGSLFVCKTRGKSFIASNKSKKDVKYEFI